MLRRLDVADLRDEVLRRLRRLRRIMSVDAGFRHCRPADPAVHLGRGRGAAGAATPIS